MNASRGTPWFEESEIPMLEISTILARFAYPHHKGTLAVMKGRRTRTEDTSSLARNLVSESAIESASLSKHQNPFKSYKRISDFAYDPSLSDQDNPHQRKHHNNQQSRLIGPIRDPSGLRESKANRQAPSAGKHPADMLLSRCSSRAPEKRDKIVQQHRPLHTHAHHARKTRRFIYTKRGKEAGRTRLRGIRPGGHRTGGRGKGKGMTR